MDNKNTENKKKLLVVITKSNFGGAQRYVFDLARSLKDTYNVSVMLGGTGVLVEKLQEAEIRTISLPFLERDINPLKDFQSFWSLYKMIKKEGPDILHLNSSKIGVMGAVISILIPKTKSVFTAHGWAFNEERSDISRTLILFLYWLTIMLTNKTIAVSGAVKSQISHLPFVNRKIEVVHLGIDKFEPMNRKEAREFLGIGENDFAIGTIAELHPIKGLDYALDALKDAPFKFNYTIIGGGDLKNHLLNKIEKDDILKTSVKLTGFVKDACKLIPAFDVFLLPSLSEAFGYVLVEAGMSKVPIIATAVGGIPEIIEDMKSGILIHARSSKEIKLALEHLYSNKSEGIKFAENLKTKTETNFSLERMIIKTNSIYRNL